MRPTPVLESQSILTGISMGLKGPAAAVCNASAMGVLFWMTSPVLQAQVVDTSTLNNKILAGYQGWFSAPGDGGGPYWGHWSRSPTDIGPGLYTVDMWPDVSELDAEELFPCPNVTLLDNSMGQLFSSRRLKTVERHFKWMKENGIDGVTVGRFVIGYSGPNPSPVLENIMSAATTHGRVFMIYYDTTGEAINTLYNNITQDWIYLVDHYDVNHHPRYQKHNGKPVVGVWGMGLGDSGHPATPLIAQQIIDFFKNDPIYGGNSVLGGVAQGWRNLSGGSSDPAWAPVYRSFDIISPWTVGSFGDLNGINSSKNTYTVPDLAECNSLGIGYLQVIWPGFSWNNLQQYPPDSPTIQRNGGQFLWDQANVFQSAGVKMMLLAMFDEVDEGTAIFKVSPNHPTTDHWVDYGTLPHDWYLRLAGAATRMIRKEIPFTSTFPINPACGGDEASINLGEDVSDRLTHPQNADGDTTVVAQGGVSCRKTLNPTTGGDIYFYFAVNDSFAFQGNKPEMCITFDYYDTGGSTASLRLDYDSVAGGAYKVAGSVTLGTSNTWKRKIFHVTDAYFGNRENAGADFRIGIVKGGTQISFYLDRVLVTSAVAKPPLIQLNQTLFAHTLAMGAQAADDTVTVINMGVAPLNYMAGANAAWLSATPTSGKSTGETDTLTVSYDSAGLSRGHHSAAVSVADATALNSPQTVAVDLDVIAFADFDSDDDADQQDFGRFQTCLTDFGIPYAPGCLAGDSNGDGAVDYQDAPAFINCMNGADRPPGC